MALFNYSSKYSDISVYISSPTNTVGANDLLKIFFSPDDGGAGHLITHGIDFTPDYISGHRGLVPSNSGTLSTTYLRGDGWQSLWNLTDENTAKNTGTTAADKQTSLNNYLSSTLVSAKDIQSWISNSFSAQDAMRFKGTIAVSGTTISGVNGGTGGFPSSCEVGDTYKVSGSGTIAGLPVNTGDMMICIKDSAAGATLATLNSATYWTVVQDNVEALVTHSFNGSDYHFYSSDTNLASGLSIFAPTTAGTKNQVLLSNGSGAPVWANQSALTAGKVSKALSAGTGILIRTSGNVDKDYDGSTALSVILKAATTSSLGGVIVDSTGTTAGKPTISVDSGSIYLTKTNIENALGYTPGNAAIAYNIIVANSGTATSVTTSAQANPFINLLTGVAGSQTVANNIQLKGGNGIAISGKNTEISITGTVFTATANGVVPYLIASGTNANVSTTKISASTYVLGSDAKWYQLPASAFEGTWRNIKVNGTEILTTAPKDSNGNANPALDLIASGKTTLTAGTGANLGKVTISSTWRDVKVYNRSSLNTDKFESIGDNTLQFGDSDGIWTSITNDATNKKTTVKSYIVWYNIDSQTYEGIV